MSIAFICFAWYTKILDNFGELEKPSRDVNLDSNVA